MSESLGSLAQSARGKQLKTAKGILFGIGILTVGANIVFGLMANSQVDEEVKKLQAQNMVVDQKRSRRPKRNRN